MAAFWTFSGVMLLSPFLATVFNAWMNMSVDAYPTNIPVSSLALAPDWNASMSCFMVVRAGTSSSRFAVWMLTMEPASAFTRMLEYSELMKMPWYPLAFTRS